MTKISRFPGRTSLSSMVCVRHTPAVEVTCTAFEALLVCSAVADGQPM